jgi:pimeloyl-ACP methyl ester carboxylesterase
MKTIILLLSLIYCTQSLGEELRSEEIEFVSHGATLSGTIVFPPENEMHSAVVFIHGSGEQTRDLNWAERFAADGIAALVYDKRGVGKSGGQYEGNQNVSEKNISLLADDAVSALRALSAQPSLKSIPLGFAGISQAGWIAPVAAERSELAKFMVLWSGPVCKVSEEDIYSKYTSDADKDSVPSFAEALRARKQKYIWPSFLGRDTDSSEDLARLAIPGLWIFSDNDASIPVDLSIEKLRALRRTGHQYEYVVFSGLGHNNMERTFLVATDWIRRSSQSRALEGQKVSSKR